jgi:hypothetical protein
MFSEGGEAVVFEVSVEAVFDEEAALAEDEEDAEVEAD